MRVTLNCGFHGHEFISSLIRLIFPLSGSGDGFTSPLMLFWPGWASRPGGRRSCKKCEGGNMANYIQIFFDFPEMTAELSFEERGRLVDAMVRYGRGDEVDVEQLTGNERFLWPVFRGQLERNGALSLVRAEAGRKGGTCTKIESSDKIGRAHV